MNHSHIPTRNAGAATIFLFGSGGLVGATFVLLAVSAFASAFGVRQSLKAVLLAFDKKEAIGIVEHRTKTNISIGGSKGRRGNPVFMTTFTYTDGAGVTRSGASYSLRGPAVPSVHENSTIPPDLIETMEAENPNRTLCVVEYSQLLPIASRMRDYSASPLGRGSAIFGAVIFGTMIWVLTAIRKVFTTKSLLERGALTTGTLLQVLVIKGKNHRSWHAPADFAANPPGFYKDGSTLSFQVMFSAGGHGQVVHQATAPLTTAMLHGAPIAVLYDPENPKRALLLHEIPGMPIPDAHGSWVPQEPAAAVRRMATSALFLLGSILVLFVLPSLMAK